MSATEREIAQRTQEKFEFYIISLVFTLLALSIQTAEFGVSIISDSFELLGWGLLLVSGIAGVWRLEYISLERVKYCLKQEYEDKIIDLKKSLLQGQTTIHVLETNTDELIPERIEAYKKYITALKPVIEKIVKNNFTKYTVHRYTFIAGLLFLLLSRGYIPARNIIEQLCNYAKVT